MNRRQNKEIIMNADISEASTGSYEDANAACSHIMKGMSLNKLKKTIKRSGLANNCSTCTKMTDSTKIDKKGNTLRSLWICLQCGEQNCGDEHEQHASKHYNKPHSDCHSVMINTYHWDIWCYECEIEISPSSRKNLLETIEFIKRYVTVPHVLQKTSANQCQKQIVTDTRVKEKHMVFNNFPRVKGLTNLGNTCFFNSVLQCLAHTPFLVSVLFELRLSGQKCLLPGGKYKATDAEEEVDLPPIRGILENTGSFTSVLCETLTNLQNTNGHQTYTPSNLLSELKKEVMQCVDGGQHDSHELLRHLLEVARNEDLQRYQSIILKELGLNERTNPEGVEINLKAMIKFYGHQASKQLLGPEVVFRGDLVSIVECLDCHHTSQRTEPFLDLSLPVMPDKPQPPVFKRKNGGVEDTFDTQQCEWPTLQVSTWKQNKQKKTVRKNRQNNRLNHSSNVSEVGEPDYNSVKTSPVATRLSPADDFHGSNSLSSDANDTTNLDGGNLDSSVQVRHPADMNALTSPNQTGVSMTDFFQMSSKKSATMSNIVNSVTSSEEFSESQSSSGVSQGSPTNSVNGDQVTEMLGGTNAWVDAALARHDRRKHESFNGVDLEQQNLCNGITDATLGISRLEITEHSSNSPNKYVTKEGECSLESCLNQFTALELMTGSNKIACEACTTRGAKGQEGPSKTVCTSSTKQYLISQVPPVLILHLKRFQAQRSGFRKVFKHVSFPMVLDLAPICKGPKKPRMYALYGVVEHSGNVHGGHYVAYVKTRLPLSSNDPRWNFVCKEKRSELDNDSLNSSNSSLNLEGEEASTIDTSTVKPPSGRWYYVSDARVSEVDENTVLQSQAYLLFYERIF